MRFNPKELEITIVSIGVVACIFTAFGLLAQFDWTFELFSHFRLQYIGLLLVSTFTTIYYKRHLLAILFSLYLVLNLIIVTPFLFASSANNSQNDKSIKLVLSNVLTGNEQKDLISSFIEEVDPDFVVLEEVDEKWMNHLESLKTRYPFWEAVPRADNFGIAFFSKTPIAKIDIFRFSEFGIPTLIVDLEIHDSPLRIIATHPVPPGSKRQLNMRNDQLAEISKIIRKSSTPVLIVGDLNMTPWSYYHRQFEAENSLTNAMRISGFYVSWPTMLPPMYIPVDHILGTKKVLFHSVETGPNIGSDHLPVVVEFLIQSL
jgi:endonuclease/exonuclease/phosphatase (EEP) superfamily protein YafD